jgi:hypothetical protein
VPQGVTEVEESQLVGEDGEARVRHEAILFLYRVPYTRLDGGTNGNVYVFARRDVYACSGVYGGSGVVLGSARPPFWSGVRKWDHTEDSSSPAQSPLGVSAMPAVGRQTWVAGRVALLVNVSV